MAYKCSQYSQEIEQEDNSVTIEPANESQKFLQQYETYKTVPWDEEYEM